MRRSLRAACIPLLVWGCNSGTAGPRPDGGRDASRPTDGAAADLAEPAPPDLTAPRVDASAVDLTTPPAVDLTMVNPGAVAACPVSSMVQLYPGPFPANPYAAGPPATQCLQAEHDVIILLGCPSNSDGTASSCQTQRADIAIALRDNGLGRRFITTGAGVQNAYIEAESLRDLLVARGVPASQIWLDPLARHTDENIYYSTKIMEREGWTTALMVSEDPGHLIMTAVCDSNCCVDLGRLTVMDFPTTAGQVKKVGHYVRFPWTPAIPASECSHLEQPFKAMCSNQANRLACKDNFRL